MIGIEVRLTKDQYQRLQQGEPITVSLLPPKQSRVERTKEEIAIVGLPKAVGQLVSAWNDSEYIKGATDEARNNPITRQQIEDNTPHFKQAIKELGVKPIIVAMDRYFKACSAGRHISDGKNRGYSHLGGFVRKLLKCKMSGEKPYWATKMARIVDDHSKLTKKIADSYAKKFLGRKAFGLENPSTIYETFCEAADWIEMKSKKLPFSEDRLIDHLLNCVEQACNKGGLEMSPGWLSTEMTWKNRMPIYLKKILG